MEYFRWISNSHSIVIELSTSTLTLFFHLKSSNEIKIRIPSKCQSTSQKIHPPSISFTFNRINKLLTIK